MREILPGIHHWTAPHPKIQIPVSSYYLAEERVLIDPVMPPEGLKSLGAGPLHILLSNRHHYRDSEKIAARFGCTVWCVVQGLHDFARRGAVRPFAFGDTLAGGIEAIEVGALCPDETALLIPRGDGVLAVADGVVRDGAGPLGFVPDEYMGDDPAAVKAGLREAYRRLLGRRFDHLLLAHGEPWVGGAKEALSAFVGT